MAIITNTNKSGEIISYKFRCCVGRDEEYKQVWRTRTVKAEAFQGLTPKKLEKELNRQYDEWAEAQKADYTRSHSKIDKERITLAAFINEHWWPDHVMDGTHTPDSVKFYDSMKTDIVRYFGSSIKLSQIDAERVKRYIKYLRTEAISSKGVYNPKKRMAPNDMIILAYMYADASHPVEKRDGVMLEDGHALTSYEIAANCCGLTKKQARVAFEHLQSMGHIKKCTTVRGESKKQYTLYAVTGLYDRGFYDKKANMLRIILTNDRTDLILLYEYMY